MNAFQDLLLALLGPDGSAKDLTLLQISLRGLIIFLAGLGLVRIGDRRSLSEKTAFDIVFLILIGSTLSRAINGSGPFFVTIGAAIVLMLIHRFFSFVAARSHKFGIIIKGAPHVLVRNGRLDRKAMARCLISMHDLEEDLRLHAHSENLSEIHLATLERSGDVSFVKKKS